MLWVTYEEISPAGKGLVALFFEILDTAFLMYSCQDLHDIGFFENFVVLMAGEKQMNLFYSLANLNFNAFNCMLVQQQTYKAIALDFVFGIEDYCDFNSNVHGSSRK